MSEKKQNSSRRQFLKKAAYTAPVILTLSVNPSLASTGSGMTRESDETETHHYSQHDGKHGARSLRKKRKHRKRSMGERIIGFVVKLFG